jgi:hypothetical protein
VMAHIWAILIATHVYADHKWFVRSSST